MKQNEAIPAAEAICGTEKVNTIREEVSSTNKRSTMGPPPSAMKKFKKGDKNDDDDGKNDGSVSSRTRWSMRNQPEIHPTVM